MNDPLNTGERPSYRSSYGSSSYDSGSGSGGYGSDPLSSGNYPSSSSGGYGSSSYDSGSGSGGYGSSSNYSSDYSSSSSQDDPLGPNYSGSSYGSGSGSDTGGYSSGGNYGGQGSGSGSGGYDSGYYNTPQQGQGYDAGNPPRPEDNATQAYPTSPYGNSYGSENRDDKDKRPEDWNSSYGDYRH